MSPFHLYRHASVSDCSPAAFKMTFGKPSKTVSLTDKCTQIHYRTLYRHDSCK